MFRVFGTPDETAFQMIRSIKHEGITSCEMNLSAKVTYLEFRCPWGYCSSKSQRFRGLAIVTGKRFVLHNYHRRLLDVATDHLHHVRRKVANDRLVIELEASHFNSRYSGRVVIGFRSRQISQIE